MTDHARIRRGSALLLALAIVTILAVMSFTLTSVAAGKLRMETVREDNVKLLAAADSAANEAVQWMFSNGDLLKRLADGTHNHPEVADSTLTPEQQYVKLLPYDPAVPGSGTVSQNDIIDSDVIDAYNPYTVSWGIPSGPIYPVLCADPQPTFTTTKPWGVSGSSPVPAVPIPGCSRDTTINSVITYRNNCVVSCKIVCLVPTPAGKKWPEGHEKFMLFATAQMGSLTGDSARYQRQRVQAVVTPTPTQVFKQAMYAKSSYLLTGSMDTDSWAGVDPVTGLPIAYGANTHNGVVASAGIVTTGGSAFVDGARDVPGPPAGIRNNVQMPLPTMTYTVPGGAGSVSSTSDVTLNGGGGTVSYVADAIKGDITVSGSGTIDLYVNGPINTSQITWDVGATAQLVIHQNDYPQSLGDTNFDLHHGNYGMMGPPQDPTKLVIMSNYTGTTTWNGNASVCGVIFAPFTTFNLNGNFDLYGSLICQGFDQGKANGTFSFHYDDALSNFDIPLNPQMNATGWNVSKVSLTQK